MGQRTLDIGSLHNCNLVYSDNFFAMAVGDLELFLPDCLLAEHIRSVICLLDIELVRYRLDLFK